MDNQYDNIIDNVFNTIDENNHILLIIKNNYNILDNFSHIIKKKNLKIDIVIENNSIYDKLIEDINGEECEDNINIYLNIEYIENKIYNLINIFHLDSTENFEIILNKINDLIDAHSLIYVYCSLSNNIRNINYKNYFREILTKYININVGNILKISDIFSIINDLKYNVISFKQYKKNNYILYGDNIVYQIIMNKI